MKPPKFDLLPRTGSACSQAYRAGRAGLPCPNRYSIKTSAAYESWKRGHLEWKAENRGKIAPGPANT